MLLNLKGLILEFQGSKTPRKSPEKWIFLKCVWPRPFVAKNLREIALNYAKSP